MQIFFALTTCALLLFFIHFGFTGSFHRTLINYDDFLFIEPISNLSLKRYFTFWVKNPYGNAHPLRDLSWMLDAWVQRNWELPSYWITQWLLLMVLIYCVWRLFSLYLSQNKSLAFCLLLLFCTHPTLVEVIQWASARRNLLPLIFLIPASTYLLKSEKEGRALSYREWVGLGFVWLLSLLCYPIGLLWPAWAYWLKKEQIRKLRFGHYLFFGVFLVAFWLNSVWKVETDLGWKQATESLLDPSRFGASFYYGWRSIGRGIWNLFFPYWLSVYYNELSLFNILGIVLLASVIVLVFRFSKKHLGSAEKKEVKSLSLLAFVFFIPQGAVLLSYGDFVWADRYTLCVLPFIFLLLGLLLKKTHLLQKYSYALFFFFSLILSFQTLYSNQRAPLWLSYENLLLDCTEKEKAPTCFIRAIDQEFEKVGCSPKKKLLEESKQIWLSGSLPYSSQFNKELPFFDSLCVALNVRNSPAEKLDELEKLQVDYQGKVELSSAWILAHIQNRNLDAAYQAAIKYPLQDNPLEITTTRTLVNFMRGQAKALCAILKEQKNSFADECEKRRAKLESYSRADYYDEATGQWATQLTLMVGRVQP